MIMLGDLPTGKRLEAILQKAGAMPEAEHGKQIAALRAAAAVTCKNLSKAKIQNSAQNKALARLRAEVKLFRNTGSVYDGKAN